MIRLILLAALLPLALAGATSPASALCKDQCIKHCMGNDTPTERANCLAREKCDDQPACTGAGGVLGTTPGSFIDLGTPSPGPKTHLQSVKPSGVLTKTP
jgi:hypothetical protein